MEQRDKVMRSSVGRDPDASTQVRLIANDYISITGSKQANRVSCDYNYENNIIPPPFYQLLDYLPLKAFSVSVFQSYYEHLSVA